MPSKKILVIVGPTASGKTALGIRLALRYNGEIVSADSMQVYRGMDIGTAKPSADELKAMILRHGQMMLEFKGETAGMREMRKHVAWYTAGMRHSAGLRRESNLISSYQELEVLLDRMTEQNLGNNLQ